MLLSYLERRAYVAYKRAAALAGGHPNQPSSIEEVEVDGLRYIRLTNVRGALAVYRIRTVNGEPVLKGLKRWPAALDGDREAA